MKNHSLYVFSAFLLLSITMGCNRNDDVTVFKNVKGYTVTDTTATEFKSIALSEGKVLGISQDNLLENEYPAAEVIDLDGKVMLPGLIDSHAHVMGLGFKEMGVDLSEAESLEEAIEIVRSYAEEFPDLPWILGRGWNHTRWEDVDDFPTATDLDEVVEDRPVWLTRVDGHAGWTNNRGLREAGISSDTPEVKGGSIDRDSSGELTGILIDRAMNLIESEIPERTGEERELAFEKALEQMRSHGLTGVHDAGVDAETWELYRRFARDGKLTGRIYGMISGAGDEFEKLSENGPVESLENGLLALRSVKLYADGALGSRGAALMEPYSDEPGNRGLLFEEEDEMTQLIDKVASHGYQASVHAIGDRANRVVLNAFEKVKERREQDRNLRHRIEHAQIVHPDDIPRFKELGIIASMQPTHATSDMNMAEDRVGSERIRGGYAWNRFLEQGTVLAGGSDFPVESVNPFFGLYAAVTRQDHDGNPPEGWYPEQAMSREAALNAFTLDAAYAAHQEDELGSLESGKWADFIIIDRDYFEIPENEIWRIQVLETWVQGEKVYDFQGDE